MKKIIFSMVAVAFLAVSCNNSNASVPATQETADKAAPASENSGKPIQLTKESFLEKVMNYEKNQEEWVYEGDKPALIDFYADWCAPCRQAAPILEELAKEYKDQIYIYKIDTQVERELAAVFGIQGIPAFLWIPMEGRPTMSSGIAQTPAETKSMFKQMIDEMLLGQPKAAN